MKCWLRVSEKPQMRADTWTPLKDSNRQHLIPSQVPVHTARLIGFLNCWCYIAFLLWMCMKLEDTREAEKNDGYPGQKSHQQNSVRCMKTHPAHQTVSCILHVRSLFRHSGEIGYYRLHLTRSTTSQLCWMDFPGSHNWHGAKSEQKTGYPPEFKAKLRVIPALMWYLTTNPLLLVPWLACHFQHDCPMKWQFSEGHRLSCFVVAYYRQHQHSTKIQNCGINSYCWRPWRWWLCHWPGLNECP